MKRIVDSKTRPNLKDFPSGHAECEGGYWTYSSRAARSGRAGWMFHKRNMEQKK